jgi:class 3 adenylate cyclase/tetratricopeptide (TPR) repeat protein
MGTTMQTAPMPSGGSDTPERRYITILFCDLVGYTQLSEQLDPEDLWELQAQYQRLALAVMERYGGFVASFSGDGILVYFGYPSAHENDAERAVRAALELLDRLPRMDVGGRSQLTRLAVRIGVHTGLVMIGAELASSGPRQHEVVGEAANLAARLQAEAPTNAVVVSQETLELVEGLFVAETLGPRQLKGLTRLIPVHRVFRPRPGRDRTPGRLRRGATRFVGRTDVLERLRSLWHKVCRHPHCLSVFVEGEAGVGKTRLVLELCNQSEFADTTVLKASCHEIFATTPLYPVGNLLWSRIGLTAEDDESAELAKVSTFLDQVGYNTQEHRQLVASMLGLALTGVGETMASTPLLLKRKQFAFVTELVEQVTRQGPTLLWIEDAHWLDPSSIELLDELKGRLAHAALLIVCTVRSFPKNPALFVPDETIALDHLAAQQCLELAKSVPGAQALAERELQRAIDLADGVPLFVEQLVLSVIDQGVQEIGAGSRPSSFPPTLAEMMSERLDRIRGARPIVQAAACIGRAFTSEFLAATLHIEEARVVEPLEALVQAEILRSVNARAEPNYEFRHMLLQRLAQESMVRVDRRTVHARIAELLQQRASSEQALPELIAHHMTAAEQFEVAIKMWLEAARSAGRRSGHIEAIEHIRRGLGLLIHILDPAVRRQLELNLQAALIGSLSASQGPTSSALAECCRRGLELCAEGEPTRLVFPFLFGQFTYAMSRNRIGEAVRSAEMFLSLAQRGLYHPGRVIGHRLLGMALLGDGRAQASKEQLELSVSLYSPERDESTTLLFGQNPQVHTQSLLSLTLFCLGQVDEALEVGLGALQVADALRHPHSTAIALAYVGGWVLGLCGAAEHQIREARRLIAVSEQHQLGLFHAFGEAFFGWALCQAGNLQQGAAVLQQAIDAFDATDYTMSLAGHLANLADAKRRMAMLDEANALCNRALRMISDGGDRWLEPEVRRIQAQVAGSLGSVAPADVEAMHRAAVACARGLGFPVFELRCLLSLQDFLGPTRSAATVEGRLSELAMFRNLRHSAARALQARGISA